MKRAAEPTTTTVDGQIVVVTADGGDMPPALKKARVAPAKQEGEVKSNHVFYPNKYQDFDAAKLVFAKDPTKSKEGNGELLYISYLFDDGVFPFMVQTPNAMYSPTGINIWTDGKASILLSSGRDWEANVLMVEFHALMDAVQKRCIEVVAEKGWNTNGSQDPQIIQEAFSDLMFVGTKEDTGEKYPPSIKAAVVIDGKDPVELFEKVSDNPTVFNCLIPSDVKQGCNATAIIHIPWIFRKKAKKGWAFSIRTTLYQARIFPCAGGVAPLPRGGCAIVE